MKKLLIISILVNVYYLSINVWYMAGTMAACESFGREPKLTFTRDLGIHYRCEGGTVFPGQDDNSWWFIAGGQKKAFEK